MECGIKTHAKNPVTIFKNRPCFLGEDFMLIRFNVKNFLSFYEREDSESHKVVSHEFSMIPGKVRLNPEHIYQNKKQNLLRLSTIYGANASGKSNLVKAMAFFQKMSIIGKCPLGATEKYSKISSDNKSKPSYFEAEILINDEIYSYGFEVVLSTGVVVSEWLAKLSKENTAYLFYKNGKDDEYHFDNVLRNNQVLEVYQQGIMGSNVLFLAEMNKDKQAVYSKYPAIEILKNVYNWIEDNLEIVFPTTPVNDVSYLINTTTLQKVAEILNAFGTGIVSVEEIKEEPDKILDSLPIKIRRELIQQIENISQNKEKNPNFKYHWNALLRNRNDILGIEIDSKHDSIKAYSLQFEHKNIDTGIHFKISEESDGTARLFELVEILLSKKNKTYIVDELDRCMHPSLTYKFIEKFFEYTQNKMVQLIVTTHESRLMDFKLLRRDEIWLVDKDNSGNSNIYSLEEYNTRFDQKVDKAYLEGRYGGIPLFTTLFPIGE